MDLPRKTAEALRQNPLRTTLTLLGVIFGVTIFVSLQCILDSLAADTMGYISQLGNSNLIIVVNQPPSNPADRQAARRLSFQDYHTIAGQAFVTRATPLVDLSWPALESPGGIIWAKTMGADVDNFAMFNYALSDGAFFTKENVRTSRCVAVIGSRCAAVLFPNGKAVGQAILIRGRSFTVVGVCNGDYPAYEKRAMTSGSLKDGGGHSLMLQYLGALIPYTTANALFSLERPAAWGTIDELYCEAEPENHRMFENTLRILHPLKDYAMTTQLDIFAQKEAQNRKMRVVSFMLAGMAFAIGGLGIFSIMLSTVHQRLREIGIKKAVGAAPLDIFKQFLMEALALSVAGGAIGLVVAVAANLALHLLLTPAPAMSPWHWLIGLLSSVSTGVIAGLYPALFAARRPPLEALQC